MTRRDLMYGAMAWPATLSGAEDAQHDMQLAVNAERTFGLRLLCPVVEQAPGKNVFFLL